MVEGIAGLITIILFILKFYIQERQKVKDTYEGDVAELDKAIAKGDADTISALFDRMRIANKSSLSGQNNKDTP